MANLLLIVSLVLSAIAVVLLLLFLKRSARRKTGDIESLLRQELRLGREESARLARELREEVARTQKSSSDTLVNTMGALGRSQQESLKSVIGQIGQLTASNESRLEALRLTLDDQIKRLRESNEQKLDQMRSTVDEKLQSTLEKRLGESFNMVRDHLEAVQRGLGEMQNLATGVGDLKRVLTNVKTRGIFGEVLLGDILEQILTPDQYATNIATVEGSGERVEFAIRLPGVEDHPESFVWLPIDAKFPQEDLHRLQDAEEAADNDAVRKARTDLLRTVEASAKDISEKYLNPPFTTDFAIMFLATESLYAEVLREPGFMQKLQHNHRVTLAGPTTLAAFVNSLRMGFRTLAIEKRSSEVWQILAAVKTEFGKFGDVLAKVKKQLDTAGNTIVQTEVRTRAMERKLKDVEQLPESSAEEVLGLGEADFVDELNEEEIESPI